MWPFIWTYELICYLSWIQQTVDQIIIAVSSMKKKTNKFIRINNSCSSIIQKIMEMLNFIRCRFKSIETCLLYKTLLPNFLFRQRLTFISNAYIPYPHRNTDISIPTKKNLLLQIPICYDSMYLISYQNFYIRFFFLSFFILILFCTFPFFFF